jgi:ribosomal protein S18 acetylase RimI-like enzyme
MHMIRPMCLQDLDEVRKVDAAAFGAWWQQSGKTEALPLRRRANVRALLERDPKGCFVAEIDDQLVGFIFARTWGSVGWLGTFAVLPQYQGQGLGKALIAAGLGYLRRDPERVIGLETMPESANNLGLYLKQGFQLRFPTVLLGQALAAPGGEAVPPSRPLPRWSRADKETRERWLVQLREATGQIQPGLDYAKEISLSARDDLGETLVLQEHKKAVGLSLLSWFGNREGMGQDYASVQALALHPAHTNVAHLYTLLDASKALARARGKKTLIVPVNAQHAWALKQLLRRGYRVERTSVRMVLEGTDTRAVPDAHVDLSRWAG